MSKIKEFKTFIWAKETIYKIITDIETITEILTGQNNYGTEIEKIKAMVANWICAEVFRDVYS